MVVVATMLSPGRAIAQSWSCSLAGSPTPHGTHVAAVANDAQGAARIYILGGLNSNSSASSAVESYDPFTDTWALHAPIPTSRAMARRAGATGANGKIYLFGGQIGNLQSGHVDEYDPVTNSWTPKSSTGFTARWLAAAAPGRLGNNTLIFVFGGESNQSAFLLSTVEAYNPNTDSWTTKASMPMQAGAVKAAAACDGLIYVFGDQSQSTEVWEYNPGSDGWMQKASMPLARDAFAVAAGRDGQIYVMGGHATGTGVCSTDLVDVYDPTTGGLGTVLLGPTGAAGAPARGATMRWTTIRAPG